MHGILKSMFEAPTPLQNKVCTKLMDRRGGLNRLGRRVDGVLRWQRAHGGIEMPTPAVTGVMLNGNLLDYKIATTLDVGPIQPVLVETGMGYGPYGLVGIGEDVATVIPALLGLAVHNALGIWVDDFPITPARVLQALGKG